MLIFSVCTLETLRYAKVRVENSDLVVDVLHVIQPSHGVSSRDDRF
jgi:hypothetical protein